MADIFNEQRVIGVRDLGSNRASFVANVGNLAVTADGVAVLLQGSASKIIRLSRVEITGVLTTAAVVDVLIARYGPPPTGGTTGTAPPIAKLDTSDAAATLTATAYTAPPAGGTFVGTLRQSKTFWNAPTGLPAPVVWDFLRNGAKAPTLRDVGDYLAIFVASSSYVGAKLNANIEFTEE